MRRFIIEKLKEWKESKYRKPLILKGARQVGKTYILKQFGEENYEGVAYFNFDHDEDLYNLFENTKDPKRILEQLAFIYGKAIMPEKTLIIFDEIQECIPSLDSTENIVEEIALTDILNRFLSSLSLEQRKIFMRRYWYLSPIKEIATEYDMSESKIKMSLFRSRNELKKLLEKEGISV